MSERALKEAVYQPRDKQPVLTVALVQRDINWQSPSENLQALERLLRESLPADCDLVVLPEVFTTGFESIPDSAAGDAPDKTTVRAQAQSMQGEAVSWLRAKALEYQVCITGSVIIADPRPSKHSDGGGERRVNRLIWARPDGSIAYYDKRFLFRMAGEHQRYAAGNERLLVDLAGWRINPLICYDLRFAEGCRNHYEPDSAQLDFDLQLFVANWPAARAPHWRCLLQARAIENLAPVVGVNRTGVDGHGLHYSGDSLAFDAKGQTLVDAGSTQGVFIARFQAQALDDYRQQFPAFLDACAPSIW